jgi:hypothetical protein
MFPVESAATVVTAMLAIISVSTVQELPPFVDFHRPPSFKFLSEYDGLPDTHPAYKVPAGVTKIALVLPPTGLF